MTHMLALTGLDGANPLAFLAALGTLRTLTDAWPSNHVRLGWSASAGAWRPVITTLERVTQAEIVQTLFLRLSAPDAIKPFELDDDLNVQPERFRAFALEVVAEAHANDRRAADFVAAFGCEITVTERSIQDTALRTMSGAGHQHFLLFMKQLVSLTTEGDLDRALFAPWKYEDAGPSLRWDPADDRRYAMRWDEPSGDPIRTVRGANRLAIEGLRFYRTAPVRRRLETTGFKGSGSRDTFWTWPIWAAPISAEVVASVVALRLLQDDRVNRTNLGRMGIVEAYRSQRLTIGKYRNLTPARPA